MVDTQVQSHSDDGTAQSSMKESRCACSAKNKKWSELSTPSRTGISLLGTVQFALLIAAQVDITRRSEREINGSKTVWRLVCLLNFIGPLSYFRWGRRRPPWWERIR
jgi:phospholipase D-like protein